MSLIWILPPTILLVGAFGLLRILRTTEVAARDIYRQLLGMDEVREAVVEVRVESARTRATMEQLRRR